jgi:hypothetical protein
MDTMTKAYALAAAAVRQRFAEQCPDHLATLADIRKRDIAVFSGTYDSVERVLDLLDLPYIRNPKKVSAGLVFANCSNSMNKDLVGAIEPHVRAGAWLVSSDWSLKNVVQEAFPGTVRHTGKSTGDEVVAVEAGLDSLWSDVVIPGADPQWWLEGGSFPIAILDEERVRVESASHEMLVRYQAPAVSVRFDWGAGHVFHVISHFWLKRSRVPDQRYRGPCTEFLQRGMRLSEEGIAKVLSAVKVEPEDLTFAAIQSAATSTELVAQLCTHAKRAQAALQNCVGGPQA